MIDTTPIIASMAVVLPATGFIAGVFWGNRIDERFRQSVAEYRKAATKALRARGQELAELRAFKYGVESQRKKAAAKGRAAQEAKRQAQKALQDATHADMRRELVEVD